MRVPGTLRAHLQPADLHKGSTDATPACPRQHGGLTAAVVISPLVLAEVRQVIHYLLPAAFLNILYSQSTDFLQFLPDSKLEISQGCVLCVCSEKLHALR